MEWLKRKFGFLPPANSNEKKVKFNDQRDEFVQINLPEEVPPTPTPSVFDSSADEAIGLAAIPQLEPQGDSNVTSNDTNTSTSDANSKTKNKKPAIVPPLQQANKPKKVNQPSKPPTSIIHQPK